MKENDNALQLIASSAVTYPTFPALHLAHCSNDVVLFSLLNAEHTALSRNLANVIFPYLLVAAIGKSISVTRRVSS
jgi:hypothetical protein